MFKRSIILITLCSTLGWAGCSTVKPYQREDLARKSMTQDEAATERRFNEHIQFSREASAGGTGEAGGGCGCN